MTEPAPPRKAPFGNGDLELRVLSLMDSTLAVAEKVGFDGAAQDLGSVAARIKSRDFTVAVVGEPNRGKTSLVNALLKRSGLLPVGHRVTTSVPILARYGERDTAFVHKAGDEERLEISIDEIELWASVEGQRTQGHLNSGVKGVEVLVPSPLLAGGLRLLDTPGVGGLESAHGRITLSSLRLADAVLFVLDAHSPISDPELRFLASATGRISTVVFALTKIDERREEAWRNILNEDRRLIAGVAPRFSGAKIMPVSSLSHEQSLECERAANPERADQLADLSGIPKLATHIDDEIAANGKLLQLANGLECSGAYLLRAKRSILARTSAGATNASQQRELCRNQLAVNAEWRLKLRSGLDKLRATVSERGYDMLQQRIRCLTESADSDSTQMLGRAVPRVTSELEAIAVDLGEEAECQLLKIVGDLERALEVSGLDDVVVDLAQASPRTGELHPVAGGVARDLARSFPTIALSALGSATLAHSVAGSAVTLGYVASPAAVAFAGPGLLFGPIGLAVGGIALAATVWRTYHGGEVRRARQVYARGLDEGRNLIRRLQKAIADTGVALEQLIDGRLKGRLADWNASAEEQSAAQALMASIDDLRSRRDGLASEILTCLRGADGDGPK